MIANVPTRFNIEYNLRFRYDTPVRESQNELRCCPATDPHQNLIRHSLTTSPSARIVGYDDYWGTTVDAFGIRLPHDELELTARSIVETRPVPFITSAPPMSRLDDVDFRDLHTEFLVPSKHCNWDGEIHDIARSCVEQVAADVVSISLAIHRTVTSRMSFIPATITVSDSVSDALERGDGSGRDIAHVEISMCRSIGIPARFVMGYLYDDTTRGHPGSSPPGSSPIVGQQSNSRVFHHAWIEVAIPGSGWMPLDAASGAPVGAQHIKIGHGRDHADIPPFHGVYSGAGKPTVSANVQIELQDSAQQQQQQW